jgi:hypothetical protein
MAINYFLFCHRDTEHTEEFPKFISVFSVTPWRFRFVNLETRRFYSFEKSFEALFSGSGWKAYNGECGGWNEENEIKHCYSATPEFPAFAVVKDTLLLFDRLLGGGGLFLFHVRGVGFGLLL